MPRLKCKICYLLPEEDRIWVNEHLIANDKTLKDMCEHINTKHPSILLNNTNLINHRNRHLNLEGKIEKVAEEEVKSLDAKIDEVFKDAQSIGSMASYVFLLRETLENYRRLKDTKGNEMSKRNYLETMAKLLEVIHKEKLAERDYMTQLNIIKEKRDKETMYQKVDSIKGWFIPEALKSAKTMNEAITHIKDLKDYTQNIVVKLEAGKNPSELARELLDIIYGE